MHDKWERRDHTRGRNQGLGWKTSGEGKGVDGKVFGREMREFLSREIGECLDICVSHVRNICHYFM